MATPYQEVANAALMQWPPYYLEEEANAKIQTESVQELESQVYAMGSMKYAVLGIAKQVGLNEEKTTKFFEAVINGPENDEIFEIVREKIQGFSEEQKLEVLATIHDGWVVDNSNEKTFNKKVDRQQLRQYAPLDLIGWNEVRNDLLFLTPILAAVGVQVDEVSLAQAYHTRVATYMEKMKINSQDDLTALVQQGRNYYPVLPEELEAKLFTMSEIVSGQMIQNWNTKDPDTAQILATRQQQMSNGKINS